MKKQGLNNPLAIASIANTKEGQKTIQQGTVAARYIIMTLGIGVTLWYANKQFKKLRAKRFAEENVGNPNLIAATIIYSSFRRLEMPTFVSLIFPDITYSVDEDQLNEIASQITNVKAVSDAYRILFDRNLVQDISSDLSTDEALTFWNMINSPTTNTTQTLYPLGSDLYTVSVRTTVNKAVKDEHGNWKGTGELYGNFKKNDLIGQIVDHGVWTHEDGTQENYYIVEKCIIWGIGCDTGVVLQHQVTNIKL